MSSPHTGKLDLAFGMRGKLLPRLMQIPISDGSELHPSVVTDAASSSPGYPSVPCRIDDGIHRAFIEILPSKRRLGAEDDRHFGGQPGLARFVNRLAVNQSR